MGAPPSSIAWPCLACECSPRLERTTTRDRSPRKIAALRIGDLQTGGGVVESPQADKAEGRGERRGGGQARLPGKRRQANRDGVQRGIGLRPGALEVVDHRDKGDRLAV